MANGANRANGADGDNAEQVLSELKELREEVARLSTLLERRVDPGVRTEQLGGQSSEQLSAQMEKEQPKGGEHAHDQAHELEEHPHIRTDHPHVVRIEGVHGGRPTIRGTGVSVQAIVEQAHIGRSPQEIMDEFDGVLALAQIYDALSYYYEHPDEIDGYIVENQAALQKDPRTPVAG
jgi:uncharacterized protein (DUF433 family)